MYPFRIVSVERTLQKNVLQAGESVEVTVTIHKRALQPFFYVKIQDVVPKEIGTHDESGSLFFFSFQSKLAFSYTIRDVKRGSHSFEHLTLVFGDLFGIFERKKTIDCQTELVVFPPFQKLSEIPPNGNPKQLDGQKIRRSFEEDRSLAGVRQYVPGDRLTSIDWKQSARSAKLMTKEFESYQGEGILVAFDSTVVSQNDIYFENSVELAASLMVTFAEKQPSLQLAVKLHDWIVVDVSRFAVSKGLTALAKVKPSDKLTPVVHKGYQDWVGMNVYYVCVELTENLVLVCKTLVEQKVKVTLCLVAITEKDQPFISELEKAGITIYVENK